MVVGLLGIGENEPAVDLEALAAGVAAIGAGMRVSSIHGLAATRAARPARPGRLADAASVDVDQVWGAVVYAAAVRNRTEVQSVAGEDGGTVERVVPRRRVVGNRG